MGERDAESWNKPTTLHFRFKRDRNKGALKGRVKNSREEKSNGKSGVGKTRKEAASLEETKDRERRVGLWMKENRKRRGGEGWKGAWRHERGDGKGQKARRVCITLHSTWRHFCVVARYFFLAFASRTPSPTLSFPRVATTDPKGGSFESSPGLSRRGAHRRSRKDDLGAATSFLALPPPQRVGHAVLTRLFERELHQMIRLFHEYLTERVDFAKRDKKTCLFLERIHEVKSYRLKQNWKNGILGRWFFFANRVSVLSLRIELRK